MKFEINPNIAELLDIPPRFQKDIRLNWYEIDNKVFLGGTCYDHSGMFTDVLDIRLQVERVKHEVR